MEAEIQIFKSMGRKNIPFNKCGSDNCLLTEDKNLHVPYMHTYMPGDKLHLQAWS